MDYHVNMFKTNNAVSQRKQPWKNSFFSLWQFDFFFLHPYGSPKRLERNKQAKHWIALINSEKGKSALFHREAILTLSGIKTLWKPSTELLPVTHLLTGRFWLIGIWSFHSIITQNFKQFVSKWGYVLFYFLHVVLCHTFAS